MKNDVIIRTVSKLLVPFIMIFGMYVIAHGEIGPGGGFQGGVIIGASVILVALVLGRDAARKMLSRKASDILTSVGVLIYAGIGIAALFAGGLYLEYGAFTPHHIEHGNHLGMTGIELGVGVTVAAVMVTIFFETARITDD